MFNNDRFLLASLSLGVWVLIVIILFKPSTPPVFAHDGCTGYGEIEELRVGGDVYIYRIDC